jgi:hypothetical protein
VRLQLADNVIDELRSRGFLKPNEPLNATIARLVVTVIRAMPAQAQSEAKPPSPPSRTPRRTPETSAASPGASEGTRYCGSRRPAPPRLWPDSMYLRTLLRDELAPIRARLATIEEKHGLLPDLLFLYDSATAQEVVPALSKMAAKSAAARGAHGARRRTGEVSC